MIINIIKIKQKINKSKNVYNLLIKIGIQKTQFLKNKYLINNCLINTWIKIIIKNNIFFFGYSNSLFLSGLIKIIFKILNNNNKNNIIIFLKFNLLKILKLNKKISNFKKESFKNILNYINNIINYN
ncbi:SufE family protein [Candidatus Carsonella ruddii]|uniref:SufE family protein n=1 Tax=Carsonella ruddii TaxID=114186 RepID=UPI003D9AA1B9